MSRSHRDIPVLIPAGGSVQVRSPGEFIFLKFADRKIRVIMDGNTIEFEPGDASRFPVPFDWFEAKNPDPDNPAQVIFVVGYGEFDRKIITGEISVIPGVRGADGSWRDDTRREIVGFVEPLSDSQRTYPVDEPIHETGTLSLMSTLIMDGGNSTILLRRVGTDTTRFYYIGPTGRAYSYESSLRNVTWYQGIYDSNDSWNVNGGPADVACVGGRFYALLSGRHPPPNAYPRCIVGPHSGTTNTRILQNLGAPTDSDGPAVSLCQGRNGLYVLMSSGNVWLGGQVVGKLPAGVPSGSVKLRYNRATREFFVVGNSGNLWRLSESFELLEVMSYGASLNGGNNGARLDGNMIWGVVGSTSSGKVGGYPLTELTTPLSLAFSSGNAACRDYQSLIWRQEDAPLIDADVVATRLGDQVEVAGEVIKALLTAATGKAVGANYLDHVYAFEFSDGQTGTSVAGRNSGGRSFAGARIEDSFVVMLPAMIKLVVDDDLPV